MSKTLADILGWEEGAVYRYNNKFFKIKHGLLVSSLTGKQNSWHVDWSVEVNSIFYLKEAIKVEPKRYYLRHKFLGSPWGDYLNYKNTTNRLYLLDIYDTVDYKSKFTEDEIKKIEATGFDLSNFEKVEVEDE